MREAKRNAPEITLNVVRCASLHAPYNTHKTRPSLRTGQLAVRHMDLPDSLAQWRPIIATLETIAPEGLDEGEVEAVDAVVRFLRDRFQGMAREDAEIQLEKEYAVITKLERKKGASPALSYLIGLAHPQVLAEVVFPEIASPAPLSVDADFPDGFAVEHNDGALDVKNDFVTISIYPTAPSVFDFQRKNRRDKGYAEQPFQSGEASGWKLVREKASAFWDAAIYLLNVPGGAVHVEIRCDDSAPWDESSLESILSTITVRDLSDK